MNEVFDGETEREVWEIVSNQMHDSLEENLERVEVANIFEPSISRQLALLFLRSRHANKRRSVLDDSQLIDIARRVPDCDEKGEAGFKVVLLNLSAKKN